MKKSVVILLVISFFLFSQVTTEAIFQTSQVPEYISIGLFFESTGRQSINIRGQNLAVTDTRSGQKLISNLPNSIDIRPFRRTIYTSNQVYTTFSDAWIEAELMNMFSQENAFVYFKNGIYQIATENLSSNIDINVPVNEDLILVLNKDGNILTGYMASENVKISSSEEKINIQSTDYRGAVSFRIGTNNTLTVINVLKLEEYLYGVVPNEMPASWSIEALKAQAVSARNYAVKNLNKYSKQGFNLCATTSSQVYKGISSEHRNSNIAVDETRGKLLYYNNEVADIYYHSSSGGRTESPENVWSSKLPHIKGVEDSYSIGSPHDEWEVAFNKDQIEKLLSDRNINIGNFINLEVVQMSENDRVMKVIFRGSQGNHTLEKESIRFFFSLKSNYFTVNSHSNMSNNTKINKSLNTDYSEAAIFNDLKNVLSGSFDNNDTQGIEDIEITKIVFNGKGWGHGVGLSQYGAKKMGELGFTYQEILEHYFTNIYIK